jgi:hypothetical protein
VNIPVYSIELTGFYNRDGECLPCGRNRIFKFNSNCFFVFKGLNTFAPNLAVCCTEFVLSIGDVQGRNFYPGSQLF